MKKLFRRKTLIDSIASGSFDDRALALRMREWILKGNRHVATRAVRLYEKQSDEKRALFAEYGLTEEFVAQQKKRLKIT